MGVGPKTVTPPPAAKFCVARPLAIVSESQRRGAVQLQHLRLPPPLSVTAAPGTVIATVGDDGQNRSDSDGAADPEVDRVGDAHACVGGVDRLAQRAGVAAGGPVGIGSACDGENCRVVAPRLSQSASVAPIIVIFSLRYIPKVVEVSQRMAKKYHHDRSKNKKPRTDGLDSVITRRRLCVRLI